MGEKDAKLKVDQELGYLGRIFATESMITPDPQNKDPFSTIDLSDRTNPVNVYAQSQSNVIKTGSGGDTVFGGFAGFVNYKYDPATGKVDIQAGAKDTIDTGDGNDTVIADGFAYGAPYGRGASVEVAQKSKILISLDKDNNPIESPFEIEIETKHDDNEVILGNGRDSAYCEAGNDTVYTGTKPISGDKENLPVDTQTDTVVTGSGNDTVYSDGNDFVYLGEGDDVFKPTRASKSANETNDHVRGGGGNDEIIGGLNGGFYQGDDANSIAGNDANPLTQNPGNDSFRITSGVVYGNGGTSGRPIPASEINTLAVDTHISKDTPASENKIEINISSFSEAPNSMEGFIRVGSWPNNRDISFHEIAGAIKFYDKTGIERLSVNPTELERDKSHSFKLNLPPQ